MADNTRGFPKVDKGENETFAVLVNDETGKETALTVSSVLEYIGGKSGQSRIQNIIDSSYEVVEGYGGGLVLIDLHPEMADLIGDVTPLLDGFTDAGLRPGRYFVLYTPTTGVKFSEGELSHLKQNSPDGLLLATDPAQLAGVAITPIPVTITPKDEQGNTPENPPYDFIEAWMIQSDETEAYATLYDLLQGIASNAAIQLAIERGDIIARDSAECDTPRIMPAMKEAAKQIPIQGTYKPRKQVDPNSKLANSITRLEFGETVDLDVSGKGERKGSITTAVTLEYEGDGIRLSKPMTQFDREVHNAVTTLWKAGNTSFTTWQVWDALTGNTTGRPSKEQLGRIEESLDKQRFTRALVDFSKEARGRKLTLDGEPVEIYTIDSYMLSARKESIVTANGRKVEGYTLIDIPVLYRHSAMFGQLVTYPARLLDTASAGQNTPENIVIKKYLLRRIGMAKGKSKTSPRVKYSSVYEKAGMPNPDKKQRKRINDYVIACLKLWEAEGHIKGFAEYKEGRVRAGVDLIV